MSTISDDWVSGFVKYHSILDYLPASIIYHYYSPLRNYPKRTLSRSETLRLDSLLIQPKGANVSLGRESSLIIILVESLDSWVLQKSIDGNVIMPFLYAFRSDESVLYCDRVKSQTKGGNSGDGQMIINTGLLPLSQGVACMNYGSSTYPNLAHHYSVSRIINPYPNVWNQDTMTVRYAYKRLIEPDEDSLWEDEQVFTVAYNELSRDTVSTCSMVITISSHAPFTRVRDNLTFDESTPKVLADYMKSLHYTDSHLARFVSGIMNHPSLSNSTIVITGDHSGISPNLLREHSAFFSKEGIEISQEETYVPLFVYSPIHISNNMYIHERCFQMDIYPTLKYMLSIDGYPWSGFGVNLTDDYSRAHREISEDKAYELSDMIIRSDYFEDKL